MGKWENVLCFQTSAKVVVVSTLVSNYRWITFLQFDDHKLLNSWVSNLEIIIFFFNNDNIQTSLISYVPTAIRGHIVTSQVRQCELNWTYYKRPHQSYQTPLLENRAHLITNLYLAKELILSATFTGKWVHCMWQISLLSVYMYISQLQKWNKSKPLNTLKVWHHVPTKILC